MPPLRSDLLEKLIGSETKAELLMYFHDNPDTTDTVEGIAAKIRLSPKEIERDVSDLVELGLLQECESSHSVKTEIKSYRKRSRNDLCLPARSRRHQPPRIET